VFPLTVRKCRITIEAFSGEPGEAPATISAMLQPDENGEPRIVELTVRASAGVELPAKVALGIDFDAIAQALSGAVEAIPLSVETEAAETKRSASSGARHAQERPYRKMPEAGEVIEVFRRGGESVGKLAAHYDVPRYTAQAWVNRLRRLGHLESRDHEPVA
jgi:hypothetical protein